MGEFLFFRRVATTTNYRRLLESQAARFARVRRVMEVQRAVRLGLARISLCGLIVLASVELPNTHAQDAKSPNSNFQSVLAKDTGKFELSVEGPHGKPLPGATVELRIDPRPTAEQFLLGKFVRNGDYGVLITTDSNGRIALKLPHSPGKILIVRIQSPKYAPYWASWSSETDSSQVPAKATVRLEALPIAEGLAYSHGGKDLLGDQGAGIFFVAANGSVRKEIGIDSATAAMLQALADQYCQELAGANSRAQLRSVPGFNDLSPDERRTKMREFAEKRKNAAIEARDKFFPRMKAVLTPEQLERLQQIAWQVYGSQALQVDADLAKAVELTQDQTEKINDINVEYRRKQDEQYFAGAEFAAYQELGKERDHKAKELLTQEQQEKLTKLAGKPFDCGLLISQTPRQQFGWFGGRIIYMTAMNAAVQKDLGLDEQAATRVKEIQSEFREAWFGSGKGFQGRRVRVSEDVIRFYDDVDLAPWDFGEWNATAARFRSLLKEALTEDQYIRLQQIDWQSRGTTVFSDAEIVQALAMTKEQRDQIAAIAKEYEAKRKELFDQSGPRGGFEGRAAAVGGGIGEKMRALVLGHDAKINSTLTAAQLEMFAMIKGKEFDVAELRTADLFPRPARGPGGAGVVGAGAGGIGVAAPVARRNVSPFVANGGIFSVAKNEAVQTELGLNKDDVTKIMAVANEFSQAWHQAGGQVRTRNISLAQGPWRTFQEAVMPPWGIQGFPGQTEEQRRQEIAKMMELWKSTIVRLQPQLKELLTEEQFTRLQQINFQAMGTAAYYSDAETIEALAITHEQQLKFAAITEEYRQKKFALIQEGRIGAGGGNDLGEKMNELTRDEDTKLNESLTKQQLEKFALMKGKEFDVKQLLDVELIRGPARGGRGGGIPPQ